MEQVWIILHTLLLNLRIFRFLVSLLQFLASIILAPAVADAPLGAGKGVGLRVFASNNTNRQQRSFLLSWLGCARARRNEVNFFCKTIIVKHPLLLRCVSRGCMANTWLHESQSEHSLVPFSYSFLITDYLSAPQARPRRPTLFLLDSCYLLTLSCPSHNYLYLLPVKSCYC